MRLETVNVAHLGGERGNIALHESGFFGLTQQDVTRLGLFLQLIVVPDINLASGAKQHSGHVGVIVIVDLFTLLKLQEGDLEVFVFLQDIKVNAAIAHPLLGLFKSLCQALVLEIEAIYQSGHLGDVCRFIPKIEVLLGGLLGNCLK